MSPALLFMHGAYIYLFVTCEATNPLQRPEDRPVRNHAAIAQNSLRENEE